MTDIVERLRQGDWNINNLRSIDEITDEAATEIETLRAVLRSEGIVVTITNGLATGKGVTIERLT